MEWSDTKRLSKKANKINSFNGTFWRRTNEILCYLTINTWTTNQTRECWAPCRTHQYPTEEACQILVPDTKPSKSPTENRLSLGSHIWESQLLIQNQSSHLKGNRRTFILLPNVSDQEHGFRSPQTPCPTVKIVTWEFYWVYNEGSYKSKQLQMH